MDCINNNQVNVNLLLPFKHQMTYFEYKVSGVINHTAFNLILLYSLSISQFHSLQGRD